VSLYLALNFFLTPADEWLYTMLVGCPNLFCWQLQQHLVLFRLFYTNTYHIHYIPYMWVIPHCQRSSCTWQGYSLYLFSCFCHLFMALNFNRTNERATPSPSLAKIGMGSCKLLQKPTILCGCLSRLRLTLYIPVSVYTLVNWLVHTVCIYYTVACRERECK
jgi:hypothetical protein